ncbi:gag-pol polyprotein [Tanacetum coccineum]
MDSCNNVWKSNTLLFEQFQKFVEMYEHFEIFLDTIEKLKKFFAFEPHAMSTSLNKAANGDSMPLAGIGSVDTHSVALSDVYYIPNLTMNLASVRALEKIGTHDISDCSGCKLAKFSAQQFSNSISSSTALFDLVHYDVWGPAPVSTKGGSRYYVSFIDDFTRYTWVYLMKPRSNFLTVFKEFRALVKTQHSTVIKCFCCDLGGEYTSNDFVSLLKSNGTIYQTSYKDTPQQNGVAERKHHHLVEIARSYLLYDDVPSVF